MRDQNLCVCKQKKSSAYLSITAQSPAVCCCGSFFSLTPSSEASKGEYGSSWISSARAIPKDREDNKQVLSKQTLLPATRLLSAASAWRSCRLLSKELFATKADVRAQHPGPPMTLCLLQSKALILPCKKLFHNTSGRLGEKELLSQGIPSQLSSEIKLFSHGPICAQGEDGRRHK